MVEAVSKKAGVFRKVDADEWGAVMLDQLGREDGADFGVGDGGVVRGSQ
jgi:hypothetical protein